MEEVSELLPFWERLAVMDDWTRPAHRALHGVIMPADDPFWDEHYPPDGFNCRCTVIARLDMPEGYDQMHPNPETTIAYDDDGQPWKAEIVGEKFATVDLTAVQFNGIPKTATLDEILEKNASSMIARRADKPIQFKEFESANSWAEKNLVGQSKKLTSKEVDYINGYTGFNSVDVNEFLRTGRVSRPEVASMEQLKRDIRNLDSSIKKSKTPEKKLVVFRGIGVDRDTKKKLKVGNKLEDLGYLSTTLIPKTAKHFADRTRGFGKTPCVFKITVTGENAVYLQPFSKSIEAEVLFARRSKLRIMSVNTLKDGSLYVSARLQG